MNFGDAKREYLVKEIARLTAKDERGYFSDRLAELEFQLAALPEQIAIDTLRNQDIQSAIEHREKDLLLRKHMAESIRINMETNLDLVAAVRDLTAALLARGS